MLTRKGIAALGVNVAMAIAAVAATWGLVRLAHEEQPAASSEVRPAIVRLVSAEAPFRPERFAFLRTGDAAALGGRRDAAVAADAEAERLAAAGPVLRASIPLETGSITPWSTEVARTVPPVGVEAAPRAAVLPWLRAPKETKRPRRTKPYTLASRLAEIGPAASERLFARFTAAKVAWPPSDIALLAVKDQRALELYGRGATGAWTLVHRYRVLAASGGLGPKLRQGDRQVPEGIYAISFLNPNSAFHVSLRVNYPNAFDRQMAAKDGRKDLGGDIMIHGKNLSAGCLAVGDEAAEELFVLAAQVGLKNVKLIIAPTDFREGEIPQAKEGQPEWLPQLYAEIATEMAAFKPEKSGGLLSFFTK